MPGTFRRPSNTDPAMGPQPPPVAPKSAAAKVTLQSWQQSQKIELLNDDISSYGNHVRCGSVDSVDSNSGSSVSSGSSSSGCHHHCRQLSNESEFIPTRSSTKAPSAPTNALQFIKVQSPLYRKAEQQIKLVKEVKISKDTLKETEEEWQSNLDNWKSRRRKVSEKVIQRAEEMRQIEAEEQVRLSKQKEQQRKTKTFSQIVGKRSTNRNYNLDLYIGPGDDSGVGGTPEPDDQEGILDNQHLHIRSDTSEGMTSETDSIDSDVHNSDKMVKEPPKVPKKPHSWLTRQDSNEIYNRTCSPNELLHRCLSNNDHVPSENLSSTDPSDVESHVADAETVSSEDDMGYCRTTRQVDSGLDSLGDSHRPTDSADSASDLSQDSCSGIDKLANDLDPEISRCTGVEEKRSWKRKPLLKSVSLQDNEFLDGTEDQTMVIRLVIKQSYDSKGFGFTLKGGKDQGGEVIVDSVSPGSAADLSGLKAGDRILTLNGEDTSTSSYASLLFTIKQATHSGELELLVHRSLLQDLPCIEEEDGRRISKRGSSFAEKLALFNGRPSSTSPNSMNAMKIDENSKNESLVLRRRSAFERSQTEKDEAKLRRSSCVTPENVVLQREERSTDKISVESCLKKSAPPVPTKPKARPKLQLQATISDEIPEICQEVDDPYPAILDFSEIQDAEPELQPVSRANQYSPGPIITEDLVIASSTDTQVENLFSRIPFVLDIPEPPDMILDPFDVPTSVDDPVYSVEDVVDALEQVTLNTDALKTLEDNMPDVMRNSSVDVVSNSEYSNSVPEECFGDNIGYVENSTHEDPEMSELLYKDAEIDENDQNILDSEINLQYQEKYVQNNVHSLGLLLEKIDEDEGGVSASTTSSSDTPDTETVIDNFPTHVSPLPNDDVVDPAEIPAYPQIPENSDLSNVIFSPPLENLEVIAEENSLEVQEQLGCGYEQVDDNLVEKFAPTLDTIVPADIQQSDVLQNEDEQQQETQQQEVDEQQQETQHQEVDEQQEEDKHQQDEDEYELEERADQLSPLDVIDQIEMKLMQQLEHEIMEDLDEDSSDQLEDEVTRQLLYLSDEGLLDDFDAPRNLIPPSEPPPPPPPEPDTIEPKVNSFQRINSTKRIKKEIWRRRSDFLGLDSPEGISIDDLPPPPPGLEELLKSEIELQKEERIFLEKQLAHVNSEEYANDTSLLAKQDYVEDYTSAYMMEVLENEDYSVIATQSQDEEWKVEDECEMTDASIHDTNEDNIEREGSKHGGSPQSKAKTHIQNLCATPRAKIMDSNKWITQTEGHGSLMKQKSVDPVFRDGSYNQNFWLAQEAQERHSATERAHVPVDRRYSMPPSYSGSSRHPNVTLRTWGDREAEYVPPLRPKSAIWQERSTSIAQSYPSPAYGYSGSYTNQRLSWTEGSNPYSDDQVSFEVSQQCSHCSLPLTEGSAMGIDALQLYFHIECFRCCICQLQLGNGTCGTDVQVKNSHLYCPKCFVLD